MIWLLRLLTCALQRRAAVFEARAAAADVAEAPAQQFPSPVAGLSDEQRAELAQELGYRQIGKDLPSDVTLQRVISTLPKDVSTCPSTKIRTQPITVPLMALCSAQGSLLW